MKTGGKEEERAKEKESRAAAIRRVASHKESVILIKEFGFRDTHAMYKAELHRMGWKHVFLIGYLKLKQPSILKRVIFKYIKFLKTDEFEVVWIGIYPILCGERTIETIQKDLEEAGISKYRILKLQLSFGGGYIHVLVGHASKLPTAKAVGFPSED